MKKFVITKREYDMFISNLESSLNSIKESIRFTGTSSELLSDNDSIQAFIDYYFDVYHTNPEKLSEIRLALYTLMGEAVIFWVGGYWKYCTSKKDEAFGTPIILGWGGTEDRPRISPMVWEILMFEDDDRTKFIKRIQTLKKSYSKT